MQEGEFYKSSEFASISEYKQFAAEMYYNPFEIPSTAPEHANTGEEIKTTTQKAKNKKSNKPSVDSIKDAVKTATQTATATASTTAIAMTAVVVVVIISVIAPAPLFDITAFTYGYDYFSYEIVLSDTTAEIIYGVSLTNGETTLTQEITDSGGQGTFSGLSPATQYTFTLHGTDESGTKTIYHTQEFVTYHAAPTVEIPTLTIGSDSVAYTVALTGGSEDVNYQARITDGTNTLTNNLTTSGGEGTFENLAPLTQYTLTVIGTDALGRESVYHTEQLTTASAHVFEAPTVEISSTEAILTATKTFTFDYNLDDRTDVTYNQLTFDVYLDSNNAIQVADETIDGKFDLQVDGNVRKITIVGKLSVTDNYDGQQYQIETQSATFAVLPQIRYATTSYISAYSPQTTIFTPVYHGDVATFTISNGTEQQTYTTEDELSLGFATGDTTTYTITAYDSNGQVAFEPTEITVQNQVTAEYSARSPNPGEIIATYNDDGTQNHYVQMEFSSQDADVYYRIKINYTEQIGEDFVTITNAYTSTDFVFVMENVNLPSYSIITEVIKQIDGIEYVLSYNYPSGTFEPLGPDTSCQKTLTQNTDANTTTLTFDAYSLTPDTTFGKIILPNGEEILLDASNFTFEEEMGYFIGITYELPLLVESCILELRVSGESIEELQLLEEIVEVKGNYYTTIRYEFTAQST